jgi:TP901 family phage tail tape measure protein
MAKFEEIGVVAVVNGFEAFVLKLTAMNKNVKKFGKGAATASGGVRLLNMGLKAVAVAGAAAIAVMGAIAVGVVKIASESVQTAASFESAFAGILKTTNNLGTNLFDLTEAGETVFQQFRDMAKEIPLSFEELAKIGEFAGQLGIPEQALAGFTETVAALGASTELTTEEAALGLARLGNVYGITADQMAENTEKLGSTIVFLGNNFNALEPEILRFAENMAGTAAAVNITQDELLAISTSFVAAGVRAEAGGSSIQRVLLEMSKAVQNGGKDLQKWAEASGKTADEFADLWGKEGGPARAFEAFVQGLAEEGEGAALVLEDLDVDTIRVLRTFLAGAGAADILTEALDGAGNAWEQNTALAREAEIRYATLDSQVQVMKNRFRDMGTTIGLMLIPALTDFIKKAQPFIEAIAENIGPAVATIGDSIRENLLPALGDLITAFTGEEIDFDKFNPEALGEGVRNFGDAVAEKIEDISGFIDQLTILKGFIDEFGAIEGVELFARDELKIPEDVIRQWSDFIKFAGIFLGIIAALQIAVSVIVPILTGLGAVMAVIGAPVLLLVSLIGLLIGLIITIGPKVATAFEQLGVIIRVKMEEAGQAIADWATRTSETFSIWIQETITKIREWATNLGQTIANFFTVTIPEKIASGIEIVRAKLDEFRTAVSEKWEAIKLAISEKWDEITEGLSKWINDSIDKLGENISKFVQVGKDIVNGIVDGIKANASQFIAAILKMARDAWGTITGFFGIESPSKLMEKTVGKPIAQGVAMGVEDESGVAERAVLQMATGTVQAAQMVMPTMAGNSQSIDRSVSIGDLNVTATPEDPISMAQRVAMVAQLQAG